MAKEISTFILLFIIASISVTVPLIVKKFNTVCIPVSVGEIIAGIIIGKSGFNIIQMNGELEFLYAVGLAFVMFLAGLEIDLSLIKNKNANQLCRHTNPLFIAALNFVISIGIAYIFASVLKQIGVIPDTVIFTIVFCSTAVGIVAPTLKEKGILNMGYGQSVLIAAVISDFATIINELFTWVKEQTHVKQLKLNNQ